MSNYTKEEKEFLDKAAIAYMQAVAPRPGYLTRAYIVAESLLTERKKLFRDE